MTTWNALLAVALLLAASTVVGVVWRARRGRLVAAGPQLRVDTASLGIEPGRRATLLQFSTRTCAHCGPARANLTRLTATLPGVVFREVDLTDDLATAERYAVRQTPTLFVLDARGRLLRRSAGPPRLDELTEFLGNVSSDRPKAATKERPAHAA